MGRWAVRTLGGEIEPELAPVLATTFVYNVSFSTFWVYAGIYAVKALGASPGQVGIMFLISAPLAGVANYQSGALSDRFGRKPLVVAGFLAAAADVSALAVIGHRLWPGFAAIALLGVVGAPPYSLWRPLVADLVPEERREQSYAGIRVAENLALALGPPFGGLLLYAGGWSAFLAGIGSLGVLGAAVASRWLPRTGGTRPRARGSARLVLHDRPYLLLLASTLLGWVLFVAYETVLPVVAVSSCGLAASTWGLLAVVFPVLVLVFQLRLTRAAAPIPVRIKLSLALCLMGFPFLALLGSSAVPVLVAVIVVFVVGDMLWGPTTQTLAARLSPERVRGAYLGALGATTGPAWTLAPLIAFQLRAAGGEAPMWSFFAAAAVAAALLGLAADRAAVLRGRG
jgi:predicted MFS family arabinose efflux permease